VLTDSNFEEAIAANDLLLVEFYAPWCGHCKSLAPEYAKAAGSLKEKNASVKLAKVDATEAKNLATQFGVQGFPTLKFFRGGKPTEYNGGRTEAEIVSWLLKKSGPVAAKVTSEEELTHLKEANDAFVLGFFASEESAEAKAFLAVAAEIDAISFAISSDDAIKNSLALTGDAIVVIKTFDDLRNDHAASTDVNVIKSFIAGASVPLIQTFSPESSQKIFKSPIQKHTLFFTDAAADHHAPTLAAFQATAMEFRGKSLFINVPSSESRVLEYFGIKPDELPKMVLGDMSGEGGQMKKYPMDGPYEPEAIKKFLTEALSGKMKPTLKSEAVAPEDTTGAVTVLKGTSFKELVIDNTNDVLVEFYAPWCGHCKKLAPIWDELGAKFKGKKDNIVIAKMDATANEIDVAGVDVKGFPTIYFFKGSDKTKPIKYEEGRELDDLVKYLSKNAHNSFNHEEL